MDFWTSGNEVWLKRSTLSSNFLNHFLHLQQVLRHVYGTSFAVTQLSFPQTYSNCSTSAGNCKTLLKTSFNCSNCLGPFMTAKSFAEQKTVLGCFVLTSVKDISKLSHSGVTCRPFLKVHIENFSDSRKFIVQINHWNDAADLLQVFLGIFVSLRNKAKRILGNERKSYFVKKFWSMWQFWTVEVLYKNCLFVLVKHSKIEFSVKFSQKFYFQAVSDKSE